MAGLKMELIFWQGLLIGFSIAVPVGPIGLLCIRRALERGRLWGLISGLGAASADAVYGCIAGFGLTLISQFLIDHQMESYLIGGLFLIYSGGKIMLTQSKVDPSQASSNDVQGLITAYLSIFVLTLTNPLTMFAYLATFAGLGIALDKSNNLSVIALVMGVFLGSTLWWAILSSSVVALQTRFNLYSLKWMNRISGLVIIMFGVITLLGMRQ